MKINEVIEQLKSIRVNSEEMNASGHYDEDEDNPWKRDIEAINITIPILEAQIAEKPKSKTDKKLGYMYVCPRCGNFICGVEKCCPDCGQKIDWSEDTAISTDILPPPEDTYVW